MNQSLGKLSPMRDDELNNEDDLMDEDFDLDESGLDDVAGVIEDDDRLLAEEPDVSDLEEIEIEEEDESDLDAGLDLGDDPVRMYLKEIGQVRLLDPQQEVWLAIQMSGADQLDRVRERLHAANKKSPPLAELMLGVYEDFIAAWDHLDKLGRKAHWKKISLPGLMQEIHTLRSGSPMMLHSLLQVQSSNGNSENRSSAVSAALGQLYGAYSDV